MYYTILSMRHLDSLDCIWIFNHSRSNHFEFWFGRNRKKSQFPSLTSFFLFRQDDARVRATAPWLIFLRKYANRYSVFSDSFAVLCSRSNSQFYGRASAYVSRTFKNTPFQRKVLKTRSKVQEKFWRIRHLTHFLLHSYLGRKSETQATNSGANE